MAARPDPASPYGLTANCRPIPGGFAGTLPDFLCWLKERLAYGGVSVGDPVPSELRPQRLVRRVELVTAGYSDDEALCGRVENGSLFGLMFWDSSHRGGLTVYEVPVERFDSPQELTWLDPPTDVFQEVHRARELVVRTPQGDEFSVALPHGARLSFSEPERDIAEPDGVLVVEPIDPDPEQV